MAVGLIFSGWCVQLEAEMEDMVRQIYRNHLDTSRQRRGIHKIVHPQINRKVSLSLGKQEYSTKAKTESIRETAVTRVEEARYEKEVLNSRAKQGQTRQKEEEMTMEKPKVRVKKSKSRMVRHKEVKGKGLARFRRAAMAVLFSIRLRRLYQVSLLQHRRWCSKWSGSGLLGVIRGQRDYYENLLSHQLYEYMLLLEDSINRRAPTEKTLLELLVEIAAKLANSTITSDMLHLLQATCTSRSFPPPDLLSLAQMHRVEASSKYGCLMGVSRAQTRMLVAMFLGVKILCFYLLLQPWTLESATAPVVKQHQQMSQTIKKVGLAVYHILLEECCHALPILKHNKTEASLSKFGVKAILQLNPFNKDQPQSTHNHLLACHSRSSLSSMKDQHPNLVQRLKQFLLAWISRISYATLTQPRQALGHSRKPSRRNYRSLDLSTNQTPSPTLTDQSRRLPRIPPPRRHY